MDDNAPQQQPFSLGADSLGWALCFELGLGVLALVFGYFTEVWPAEKLAWPPSPSHLLLGLAAALPPLGMMVVSRRSQLGPLRDLTSLVDQKLTPMFRNLRIRDLAVISLAAGIGEELLFRGLIQAELTQGTNIVVGVLMASFVFGLVHFLSPAYFAMAFAMSVYLGWLFWYFDSLWIPILGHAFYDFFVLLYLRVKDPTPARLA